MKVQGMLVALTVINLALLSVLLARGQRAVAGDDIGILRGRGLQIVDDRGRVRAQIAVFPADSKFKTADGKPYPETVLLRLINEKGAPNVKIGASTDGAGLGLGGDANPTYIQMIARGDETFINMTNKDGKKKALKPGSKDGPAPYFPSK